MIPAISLMIGFYVITRMLNLIIDKRKETGIVTAALAVVTILMACYAMFYCITKGTEITQLLK